jgi:hypothetical protein
MVIFFLLDQEELYHGLLETTVKLAVTEAGALRVRFCGEVVPERAPENPEKE